MKTLATMLVSGLVCLSICAGCTTTKHTASNLPRDCDRWLASYFRALKAKDSSALKDLTSHISAHDVSRMGAETAALMQKDKEKIEQKLYDKTTEMLGDFRDYNIVACKVSHVDAGTTPGELVGAGQYTNVVCDTMYSKKNVKESFVLYKGPDDQDIILQAHSWEGSAL